MKTGQKSLVASVILVVSLLFVSLAPALQPDSVQAAGTVGIRIVSAGAPVAAGDVFEFSIWLDAGSEQVMAVDISLDFEPAYLEVVDSQGKPLSSSALKFASAMPYVLRNMADNAAGTIDYSAGVALGSQPATGSFMLASGYLRAKANTPGTRISPHNNTANPSDFRNPVIASPRGDALPYSAEGGVLVQVGPVAGTPAPPTPTSASAPAQPSPTPPAVAATATPPAATATRVASSVPALTATPGGSQSAPSSTAVPPAAGQSSPIPGSPVSTRPAGSAGTTSPAGTTTPGAVMENASPPPGRAAPQGTPTAVNISGQLGRLPVESGTPANPSTGPSFDGRTEPEVAGSRQGVDITTFVVGVSIVLILVAGLVVARRRFL